MEAEEGKCLRHALLLCVLCAVLYSTADCQIKIVPGICLQWWWPYFESIGNYCMRSFDTVCNCTGQSTFCEVKSGKPFRLPYSPPGISFLDIKFKDSRDSLDSQSFVNASTVTQLSIQSSRRLKLSVGSLERLKNLTCINLDRSRMLFQTFRYILSIPTLQHVSCRFCRGVMDKLEKLRVPRVTGYNLKTLRLSSLFGGIHSKLDLSVFCPFQKLVEIDVSYGFIRYAYFSHACGQSGCFQYLEKLHLQNNKLAGLPFKDTKKPRVADSVGINTSKSISLSENVCFPRLQLLNLSKNRIREVSQKTFNWKVTSKSLTLELAEQKGKRHGGWTMADFIFQGPQPRTLSLAGNNIDFSDSASISGNAFATNRALRHLILDDNDFFHVDEGRFLELFGGLHELRSLSMQLCRLEDVSMKVFAVFPLLSELNLAHNRILHISPGAFDSLKHIRFLDVSANRIETVDEDTFSTSTQHQLSGLYLFNNHFRCSCDLLWFRDWLVANPSLFHPPHRASGSYDCGNKPKTAVEEFVVIEQACLLSREVSTHIILSCSLVLTVLTAASLFYRYRWHLRLLLYEAFRGRGDVRQQRLQTGHFDYDVFVSYCGPQLPWVQQHLLLQLEERQGLNLCLHERDFIPGRNIVDNIVDCVQSSKKVLMVFSRHFVLSQWCQFELAFCLKHVMDYDDALIVVCVDDVASRQMTPAMMAVLKTTTYLQWGEEEEVADSFWSRLQLALAEIMEQRDDQV